MAYLLGIDLGTSSVKAVLMRVEDTHVLASDEQEYPLLKAQPDYAEQHPQDWWAATIKTIQHILNATTINPQAIRGIGLSGQMHGTVCLDEAAIPLRPAIIWADNRSQTQCKAIEARIDLANLATIAPGLPASGFMATTLMWLHEHEPETIDRTKTVLLPKDYVRYRLTGDLGTDISDAAATWLFDIEKGEWSQNLIDLCGINSRYLPSVVQSSSIVGTLSLHAATQLGLSAEIPVVAGCADQPAQALGNGIFNSGKLLLTIGTGGQIFHPQTTPTRGAQSRYYVFNHTVPNRWYALLTILAGGLALRWLRDLFGMQTHPNTYEMMSAMASQVPIGSDNLYFIPHLAGERLPRSEPPSTGAFLGLRLHHGPEHLIHAVMEGVTFAMKDQLSLLVDDAQIIVSGGAAKSPLWRQIQADIYAKPLFVNPITMPVLGQLY